VPTLIIDNYDSFTYNLVHAVAGITGEMPVVIRNDEKTWDQIRQIRFDHLIISPGPGRPDRTGDFGVSAEAILKAEVPVLGVCLGHQGIACAFGGTVVQGDPMHGRLRAVTHDGDELFAGIPRTFNAVRYHSLVVAEPLPGKLRGIAWSPDGTLMALRHVSRPIWGVQFHPESILSEYGTDLLRNFLEKSDPIRRFPLEELPETLFRRYYAGRPGAFWLDGWDGFSYMGAGTREPLSLEARKSEPNLPFPFAGGYVGYFTYEGEEVFVRVENFLVINHTESWVCFVGEPPEPRDASFTKQTQSEPRNIRYRIPRADYLAKICRCLEWIRAGESYELCLTNQLLLETDLDPLEYYENLRRTNPAPYAAYLNFGDSEIACSSPERFLRIDRSGQVESRPIKGTLPLDRDPDDLLNDERFRAENLMIVDLVRHDLSRVCEVGSVKVPRLMEVETYSTVHQLVSTITGKLRPDVFALDCVRAAFPGGSMTGAPKKRSMELLAQLEQEPRGIYSGSIGYLGFNGTADLNIVIRTAVFKDGLVSIGVGGAIIAQSEPNAEWDEIELKAQALRTAAEPRLTPLRAK
jgi:para-aminobenzoate synthetase